MTPVGIPDIVHRFIQCLGFHDYLAVRQVCKLWKQAAEAHEDYHHRLQGLCEIPNLVLFNSRDVKWRFFFDYTNFKYEGLCKIVSIHDNEIGISSKNNASSTDWMPLTFFSFEKPFVIRFDDYFPLAQWLNIHFLVDLSPKGQEGKLCLALLDSKTQTFMRTAYQLPISVFVNPDEVTNQLWGRALAKDQIMIACNRTLYHCHLFDSTSNCKILMKNCPKKGPIVLKGRDWYMNKQKLDLDPTNTTMNRRRFYDLSKNILCYFERDESGKEEKKWEFNIDTMPKVNPGDYDANLYTYDQKFCVLLISQTLSNIVCIVNNETGQAYHQFELCDGWVKIILAENLLLTIWHDSLQILHIPLKLQRKYDLHLLDSGVRLVDFKFTDNRLTLLQSFCAHKSFLNSCPEKQFRIVQFYLPDVGTTTLVQKISNLFSPRLVSNAASSKGSGWTA